MKTIKRFFRIIRASMYLADKCVANHPEWQERLKREDETSWRNPL